MVVALLLALVLLLTSCYPTHPQSTFEAAGPVSKNLLNLFWIIFWIAVVVFVVVVGPNESVTVLAAARLMFFTVTACSS